MTSTRKSAGWFVAIAALCINLILGMLYSWSVISKSLIDQGWTSTQASIPYIVSVASFAITMIFAGKAQDKYGPRPVAIFGGILLGGGLMASSLAQSFPLMVLTFGIIGGMGIGFGYSAVTPCSIKWFDSKRKGLISGIVVSGVGLSPVYLAPITNTLLKTHTVEQTFLYLGIFSLVGVVLLSLFIKNPPEGYVPQTAAKQPVAPQENDYTWRQMVGTKSFWLLFIAFMIGGTAGLMLIGHVARIAKVQAGWEGGFLLVVILAVFNALGRLSGGVLSDKIGRTTSMLLFFLVQAVNMFLFSFYLTVPTLIVGTIVAGWAYGALFSLFPAATGDFFGMKNFGVNYGLIFCGWGLGGVVGPLLGGLVADANNGDYSISYVVSAVMLLIGAAIVKLTKAPVK